MQFPTTTTLLALASTAITAVSANTYSLYCGSSCDSGSLVSSGADYAGASCTNLDTSMPYCYLVSDEAAYKAIVSKADSCIGGDEEQVVYAGECYEGPWESFQVSVSL